MKKLLIILLVALLVLSCASCGESGEMPTEKPSGNVDTPTQTPTGGTSDEPIENKPQNVLFDTTFSEGIKISNLNSHEVGYTWWKYGEKENSGQEPFWSLGQYGDLSTTRENYDSTKNDLSLGNELFDIPAYGISGRDGDFYTLTNASGSKYISVDTKTGELNLNVDTSKEYINQQTGEIVPRASGEDWAHMIIQQTPGVYYIADLESFIMELDFTVTENTVFSDVGGASQFQWIFTLHDKESTLKDYLWFNVTLFDNRYEVFPGTQMLDSGKADATGKFIYAPRGDELFPENGGRVEIGKTYHVRLDLKQHMKAAFDLAKSNGALPQAEWEDMAINGFNIGWEVTNVSRVGVNIKNMSLTVVE